MFERNHTPELLAPAGGRAQLEAAVRFGADAVYFACDRFGLRQRAENFALDEVPSAVACAHASGARAYVALNTLMDADDVAALPAYLEAFDAAGADALIVSDLGALSLARKHAPSLELHVSTQAGVMNAEAARMWHELGAGRVVCAREMSVADIARLRADAPRDLEIEAFVHGAMCMAVSGRCLISSVMTGRSGNKGHCAQPCRWSYALVEERRPGEFYPVEEDVRGAYVMNARDLNMIAHLDYLIEAGVDSLKIEGRNKKAFYVATAVHAYRSVLDGADVSEAAAELDAISHRPYSTGFYYGRAEQSPERDGYVRKFVHAATVERAGAWSSCATTAFARATSSRCSRRAVPSRACGCATWHGCPRPRRTIRVTPRPCPSPWRTVRPSATPSRFTPRSRPATTCAPAWADAPSVASAPCGLTRLLIADKHASDLRRSDEGLRSSRNGLRACAALH